MGEECPLLTLLTDQEEQGEQSKADQATGCDVAANEHTICSFNRGWIFSGLWEEENEVDSLNDSNGHISHLELELLCQTHAGDSVCLLDEVEDQTDEIAKSGVRLGLGAI